MITTHQIQLKCYPFPSSENPLLWQVRWNTEWTPIQKKRTHTFNLNLALKHILSIQMPSDHFGDRTTFFHWNILQKVPFCKFWKCLERTQNKEIIGYSIIQIFWFKQFLITSSCLLARFISVGCIFLFFKLTCLCFQDMILKCIGIIKACRWIITIKKEQTLSNRLESA